MCPGAKESIMGGASAAVVAASDSIANAVKACGTLIHVEPNEFIKVLTFQKNPLIVRTKGGFISTSYKYLTSYKGLAFFCKSRTELHLPAESQLIHANKMAIPDI